MDVSAIIEAGKAFGVAGVILGAMFFGAWRIMQRLMPKVEAAFDRHNTLVDTLRDAVNQMGLSIATLTQHASNHADKLDSVKESIDKLHERFSSNNK